MNKHKTECPLCGFQVERCCCVMNVGANLENGDTCVIHDDELTMTFSEFADYINGFSGERPEHQRLGQWAFNLLWDTYPAIAQEIMHTADDPFYVDDRMLYFLRKLLTCYVVMDDPSDTAC